MVCRLLGEWSLYTEPKLIYHYSDVNNERNGVSNNRRLDCLHIRFFRRRSKKTSKLPVTGFVWGIHRWPVNSPPKGPVTRIFFHLMTSSCCKYYWLRFPKNCWCPGNQSSLRGNFGEIQLKVCIYIFLSRNTFEMSSTNSSPFRSDYNASV